MKLHITKIFAISLIIFCISSINAETASATVLDFLNNIFETAPLQPVKKIVPSRFMSTEIKRKANVTQATKATQATNSTKANNKSTIVDLNDPNVQLNEWMTISSKAFANRNKYPQLISADGSQAFIDLAKFERVNANFATSKLQGATLPNAFWFKMRGEYIYYSSSKEDINVLDAIFAKEVTDNSELAAIANNTQSCFNVVDYDDNSWKICAPSREVKKTWMCSLQKYLSQALDYQCAQDQQKVKDPLIPKIDPAAEGKKDQKKDKVTLIPGTATSPAVERKRVIQPVIVIPMASKPCNDKWTYLNKGNDWECICKEGLEQSPIDLPNAEGAMASPLKPLFQYDIVSANAIDSTLDGLLTSGEPLKIRYEQGAIRIYHANMGKIVAIDGAVYVAEEIAFHTPSEHKINGQQFDMEMQVIHFGRTKGDIAKQVILSFLFKKAPGVYNKLIDKFDFFNLPSPSDTYRDINSAFFIPSVFYTPEDDEVTTMQPFSFFTYEGSLTMPPCSQRTTHYIASEPIPISNTVLTLFKEALNKNPDLNASDPSSQMLLNDDGGIDNNRDTQPLNGRKVFIYDHRKYDYTEYKPTKKKVVEPDGHYEKVQREATQYVFVSGDKPTGLPGAFVVSEQEAVGGD